MQRVRPPCQVLAQEASAALHELEGARACGVAATARVGELEASLEAAAEHAQHTQQAAVRAAVDAQCDAEAAALEAQQAQIWRIFDKVQEARSSARPCGSADGGEMSE